jgi:hypothetical protein
VSSMIGHEIKATIRHMDRYRAMFDAHASQGDHEPIIGRERPKLERSW